MLCWDHNNPYCLRHPIQCNPRGGTLECDIDHMDTVGLFNRFSLFHTCIDQKVHHVVSYSHLDSCVIYLSSAMLKTFA